MKDFFIFFFILKSWKINLTSFLLSWWWELNWKESIKIQRIQFTKILFKQWNKKKIRAYILVNPCKKYPSPSKVKSRKDNISQRVKIPSFPINKIKLFNPSFWTCTYRFSKSYPSIKFSHILRDFNGVVHFLSKLLFWLELFLKWDLY